MLPDLTDAREPVVLEQLDGGAEQEAAVRLSAGCRLRNGFDEAPACLPDLRQCVLQCCPRDAVPAVALGLLLKPSYGAAVAEELQELIVPDAAALRAWLVEHHATSPGVWLALTRRGGTTTTLTWQEAVDEALCFGWIDGQARKRDEQTSCVRYTPRRSRSMWSARNVENVARLVAEGRMTDAGRAAVEAAKADGRWERAYSASSDAEIPADLAAAIAAVPEAQAMFDVLTRTNRYALIHRLTTVKKAETRQRKIEGFVAMLARHEAPHPQKAKPQQRPADTSDAW